MEVPIFIFLPSLCPAFLFPMYFMTEFSRTTQYADKKKWCTVRQPKVNTEVLSTWPGKPFDPGFPELATLK